MPVLYGKIINEININNKLLDIREDLLQISNWNGVLLFWGVVTFNPVAVNTSRLSGVSSMHVGEMTMYTTGSYELKIIVAVYWQFY